MHRPGRRAGEREPFLMLVIIARVVVIIIIIIQINNNNNNTNNNNDNANAPVYVFSCERTCLFAACSGSQCAGKVRNPLSDWNSKEIL